MGSGTVGGAIAIAVVSGSEIGFDSDSCVVACPINSVSESSLVGGSSAAGSSHGGGACPGDR